MRQLIAGPFTLLDSFATGRANDVSRTTESFGPEQMSFGHEPHFTVDMLVPAQITYDVLATYWRTARVEDACGFRAATLRMGGPGTETRRYTADPGGDIASRDRVRLILTSISLTRQSSTVASSCSTAELACQPLTV